MKVFGTTANICIGTNKVISSTNCYWGKVISGSYFKFNKDSDWIKIVNSKSLLWIKEFTSKHKNVIILSENAFPYLQIGDELEITYKEYELLGIKVISNTGFNYSVGEIIYFNGGNVSLDLQQSTSLKVKSVGENGEIIDFEIFNKGKYLVPPKDEILTTSSGTGNGASFYADFKEIELRGHTERKISSISYSGIQTIISLNSSLPEGLEKGKLSVKKWEITLDSQYFYRDKNVISEDYDIHNDFIPGNPIPILKKGHNNPDLVINKGFEIIWNKIIELEKKIEELNKNK